MKVYNTLTRRKETFKPLKKGHVGLYTCGPTVYNYAHIGNLRMFIFEDMLERALLHEGYRVKRVMNITDVGHLTSDADTGEDKLEKGAKREKKSPWDIAKFYTKAFLADFKALNIKKPEHLAPATRFIPEQITLIERLFARGYAYETSQAIYFDITKFKGYGKLAKSDKSDRTDRTNRSDAPRRGRAEVVEDAEKRHPRDFALWFKRVGRFKNHVMYWASPWGVGFPGWHIECSAISSTLLGQPFDIHTGGVDHIPVHHTNEIAQSEGATGKPLARYWVHGEFLNISTEKMAKSSETFITLSGVIKKGFEPLVFRYFALGAQYRTPLTFSWDALRAAGNAFIKLQRTVAALKTDGTHPSTALGASKSNRSYRTHKKKFDEALADDLNTPRALAVVWGTINDARLTSREKLTLLLSYDEVLGLGLKDIKKPRPVSATVSKLAEERELYRRNKQFTQADALRARIDALGYTVDDTPAGPMVQPK
ncbi:MAG: cysteine--tRNA ligase [Candidatus Jorgensenbacteria bacterium]|nr:cysteine--tRNA ligase [Candidatus Jorgensenbacteria bacterium]